MIYGAAAADWDSLSAFTDDLLPCVSAPGARISPASALKGLGKTPSIYTSNGVVGISAWTEHHATSGDIAGWRTNSDYGICVQTRRLRALDVDIDADSAEDVRTYLERYGFAIRYRDNSKKFLAAFIAPDPVTKRRLKTTEGIIELLGTGQQFVAYGTHPSGSKYKWVEGGEFKEISTRELDIICQDLELMFGIDQWSGGAEPRVAAVDPVAKYLTEKGYVRGVNRDGKLFIDCPFAAEHTSDSGDSSTAYFPAHTGGHDKGHFNCKHAHCEGRMDAEYLAAIGYATTSTSRFPVVQAGDYANRPAPAWIIKGVLPEAGLGVLYGAPGAGKSFVVLDMCMSVARGVLWSGRKVSSGSVVYIAAEGGGGVSSRLKAYAAHNNVDLTAIPFGVIGATPDFGNDDDVVQLGDSIQSVYDKPRIIVADTLATVMLGGNENSSEDVGRVLRNCAKLHQQTGALVLLVHHAGKDATRGGRGWSGIRGQADVEIFVDRQDESRTINLTKLKDGNDRIGSIPFSLREIPLFNDADGDPVTSCVVEI